jgi:DNA-binding PadR family transcriptional regulator
MFELASKFKETDLSEFPNYYDYHKILDKVLWVLWVAKDKFNIKILNADTISTIIKEAKEENIEPGSVTQALRRAGKKVCVIKQGNKEASMAYYEIMRPGKDYLQKDLKKIQAYFWKAGNLYNPRRSIFEITSSLKGEIRIVDPYCGVRTLDFLEDIGKKTRMLTRLEKINDERKREKVKRDIQAFLQANSHIEIRNASSDTIHDRYIFSNGELVILGQGIKDLGNKDSFVIIIEKDLGENLIDTLIANFEEKWRTSTKI